MLSLARQALSEGGGEGGEGDQRAIVAHVFSNAGFLFSGTCLAREAQKGRRREDPDLLFRSRLRGVIFDSCPARVDEDMALRGISAAARGVPAARAKAKAAGEEEAEAEEEGGPSTSTSTSSPHSILSPPPLPSSPQNSTASLRDSALKLALCAFLRSGPIERAMEAAWRAWEGPSSDDGGGGGGGRERDGTSPPPPPSCPRVYAYSLTDALIPPGSVEEVAAAAAARAEERERQRQSEGGGAAPSPPLLPAVSLRLFDSPHCEHLRRHPREYLELMESFSRAIEEEEDKEEDAILQV